jgi:hypothetical protein
VSINDERGPGSRTYHQLVKRNDIDIGGVTFDTAMFWSGTVEVGGMVVNQL